MNFNFKGLPELFARFPDDASARHYFESLRWDGCPKCPYCGSNKYSKLKCGKRYKCYNKKCYKTYSVTVGTVFESSRIPMNIWFAALYLISAHKKGISSYQLGRDLCVTQKTAWFMLHRLREAMRDKAIDMLKNIVEIDETYVGGKIANKHKKVRAAAKDKAKKHTFNKSAVMGFVERKGKVTLKVFSEYKDDIKAIIAQHVDERADIMTDGSTAYNNLDQVYNSHGIVRHVLDEFVIGNIHTNTVEGLFSHLKRMVIGIYHHMSAKHIGRYCDELAYRFNFREMADNVRFTHALNRTVGRLSYKQLTGKA
jgi:transposase-like protein